MAVGGKVKVPVMHASFRLILDDHISESATKLAELSHAQKSKAYI